MDNVLWMNDSESTALEFGQRFHQQSPLLLGDAVDENAIPNNNERDAGINAPPSSNSALIGRIEKIREANELEKRKRTTDYIWDNKAQLEKFCKERKKLAQELEDLGAATGCFGYLYLSKLKVLIALLITVDTKRITVQNPLNNFPDHFSSLE